MTYGHKHLSSGSLASRKHRRTAVLVSVPSIADLASPLVLLEEPGRVGVLCFRHDICLDITFFSSQCQDFKACNIWKFWSFAALKFYDALSPLVPWNLKDRLPACLPSSLVHSPPPLPSQPPPICLADSQGHCCSVTCKVLYHCGVLDRITTDLCFLCPRQKAFIPSSAPPPSSIIPVNCCDSKIVTN